MNLYLFKLGSIKYEKEINTRQDYLMTTMSYLKTKS